MFTKNKDKTPRMTKHHYELIARAVRDARKLSSLNFVTFEQALIDRLGFELLSTNERFDRAKFIALCKSD